MSQLGVVVELLKEPNRERVLVLQEASRRADELIGWLLENDVGSMEVKREGRGRLMWTGDLAKRE